MRKSVANRERGRKKILIYGYTRVNFGDDLFFKILVERYPDVEFYMLAEDDYSQIISCDNFHSMRRNRINKIFASHIPYQFYLHRFDAVICIGGSIFMEMGTSGSNRIVRFLLKYKRKFPSVPIYIVGSNYGPEQTTAFRESVKELFTLVESVTLRDSVSHNIFKDNPRVAYAPDVIFQLALESKGDAQNNIVGFSLIDLPSRQSLSQYNEQYEKFILHHISNAIAEGKSIRLFSFCNYESDNLVCERIVAQLGEKEQKCVEIVTYDGEIESFLNSLKEVDLLYASRFHAAILGISMQIPTIPVVYSDKTINVLFDLRYKGDIVDIRSLGEITRDLTIQVMERRVIDELIKSSQNHFRLIDELVTQK